MYSSKVHLNFGDSFLDVDGKDDDGDPYGQIRHQHKWSPIRVTNIGNYENNLPEISSDCSLVFEITGSFPSKFLRPVSAEIASFLALPSFLESLPNAFSL